MKKPLWVIIGVVLILAGLVWTLQGTNVIQGSSMSDTTTWSVIGPIVLIIGVIVGYVGLRGSKR
ncbi:MAG TPA: hypothetical protein VFE15_00720 [Marmoricola sp.]|jgi:hypothetical protein|nr:hypothetical protein [Marmoricola sp.]